ncbi:MAG: ParB/RepB/Spo0J family partition protein, partial [Promethearchaeota archaeon]
MKIKNIRIDKILISKFNCRKFLEDLDIEGLANSIKKYGLFQPIIVRKKDKKIFKLIIGQRRLLAFKKLRRITIPAIILQDVEDLDALAISLQ